MKTFTFTSFLILLLVGFIYIIYLTVKDFRIKTRNKRDLEAEMLKEQENWRFACRMEQKLEDIEEKRYEYGSSYWTEEDSKLQDEHEKTRMRWEDDDLPF
jgi:hypothetical protein